MSYSSDFEIVPPDRDQVDRMPGITVLEFGTPWCGHCQRAQPLVRQVLEPRAEVKHMRIEDGPGERLGRSFSVKLWPTLVFLRDGKEVSRRVRPQNVDEIEQALAAPA